MLPNLNKLFKTTIKMAHGYGHKNIHTQKLTYTDVGYSIELGNDCLTIPFSVIYYFRDDEVFIYRKRYSTSGDLDWEVDIQLNVSYSDPSMMEIIEDAMKWPQQKLH